MGGHDEPEWSVTFVRNRRSRCSGIPNNDTAFMNQSVFDYCKGRGLEQTRSRAYKKNDQAWVEQKNGSVVRRLVGYGRLSGSDARNALADLYASSRLYINFFQPSFKLKSKTRDGARVHKVYLAPKTPCDRLLAHESVQITVKEKLKAQFNSLGPVRLLREMRTAQQKLSEFAAHGRCAENAPAEEPEIAVFLSSLALAWKEGEARPTHQKRSKATHWWRTLWIRSPTCGRSLKGGCSPSLLLEPSNGWTAWR
jgi:hypothetical protein